MEYISKIVKPSDLEIKQFLIEVNLAISNDMVQPLNNRKNRAAMATLGLTPNDILCEIQLLEEYHYYDGPLKNRNNKKFSPLWIFKKKVFKRSVYIKLEIRKEAKGMLIVWSFHEDGV